MPGYTVVDVETTGLSPATHDRVVEIGVVYVSPGGDIQDSWSTLVNPQRDVGPTHIHGIRATDILHAPTFAELAPYVLRAVAGRTVVAHNAAFDLRFLAHEFVSAGVPLSQLPLQGLCTMQWSTAYLRTPSRRLVDCCRAAGIDLRDAHSALSDALATARLLGHYIRSSRTAPPWSEELAASRAYPWPPTAAEYPTTSMLTRSDVPKVRPEAWLDTVVSHMPHAADSRVDSYLAVLEMALMDGFLAEHEKEALVEVAHDSGLSRGDVLDVHRDYLRALAEVAWEDHEVTDQERNSLLYVASVLGLKPHEVDEALAAARAAPGMHRAADVLTCEGLRLVAGDRIVLTGDMQRERIEWEHIARTRGLVPGGVTKATKVVVAADPNSLSGKAAKARSYGIPIITERAFEGVVDGLAVVASPDDGAARFIHDTPTS